MSVECERQPRDLWSNGHVARQLLRQSAATAPASPPLQTSRSMVEAAVAAREDLRETDKKDTRVLIQPHPDVLIIPPDPPQLLVKLGQVRTLIQRAHYLPSEAPRRIFIITASSFMKEAANSLLKILEEPPALSPHPAAHREPQRAAADHSLTLRELPPRRPSLRRRLRCC